MTIYYHDDGMMFSAQRGGHIGFWFRAICSPHPVIDSSVLPFSILQYVALSSEDKTLNISGIAWFQTLRFTRRFFLMFIFNIKVDLKKISWH